MRLDQEMLRRKMVATRSKAAYLIRSGAVLVNGVSAGKCGCDVGSEDEIRLAFEVDSVSALFAESVGKGAVKLDFALRTWDVKPLGLCVDIGASTGGFTETLLKHGAERVIAVDVGKNQLSDLLRTDERVLSLEETDIRCFDPKNHPAVSKFLASSGGWSGANTITCDVSFISLTKILPAAIRLGAPGCRYLFLIKPQFELEGKKRLKHGVVRKAEDRTRAVARVVSEATALGLHPEGVRMSPVKGGSGNVEFLAFFLS